MDLKARADKLFKDDRFATEAAGIEIEAVDEKHVRCRMEIRPTHLNAAGVVMGGAIFTLADYTFAIASNQESMSSVSVSSTIEFMRATTGPVLFAESTRLRDGHSLCFYQIDIIDEKGRNIARVTTTGYRRDESRGK